MTVAGVAAHPVVPRGELLDREGVVQAEHPLQVLDRGERRRVPAGDALGGRGGRAQARVRVLDRLQLAHGLVVLGVARRGLVEYVVAVGGLVQLRAQLGVPGPNLRVGAHLGRCRSPGGRYRPPPTRSARPATDRVVRPAAGPHTPQVERLGAQGGSALAVVEQPGAGLAQRVQDAPRGGGGGPGQAAGRGDDDPWRPGPPARTRAWSTAPRPRPPPWPPTGSRRRSG